MTPLTTHHAGNATNEPASLGSVETFDTAPAKKSNIESLIHRTLIDARGASVSVMSPKS